ncbi:MAG: hypothetical protein OEV49_01220 [candidate division Zixibacteria bacterium]|nr:hypothetical protein [candidate division Zixibacteria bacterium]MDH3937189.1 hypothetical protein [candidate division Zixibacteria bacterium]MDH4032452.1 hypothetical protein [candidate division Zixibacteria bacterium]
MRNLILCLMFGLIFIVAGCADDDETNGDINNGGNGGGPVDSLRSITLDHVDGSPAAGKISVGTSVVFYLRLKNASGFVAKGITNGWRIYSTDNATWTTTSIDTTGALTKDDYDLIFTSNSFSISGSGSDTVAYGGASMSGPGMVDGFDDVAYAITIGPIDASQAGKHICLDSSFYPPSGTWMWSFGSAGAEPPGWDGPHCFEVVP